MDTAKLFKNGRSQAVRLPKKYRFDSSEVLINKVGEFVILIPKDKTWENLEKSLSNFSEDYMKNRNQPEIQER